ncbi:U3 snoRNP protein [Mycoemilia scoparia]|uniref:U3 small nucleolar ribonucleoprotein protein MPP10 n=1 Tax=Mycoemilia scoparia TaxID=417184 RepID=A0A9W8DRL2_9FUNG|nr:U3 snoRNP protein [Mycoemilia scoparia]
MAPQAPNKAATSADHFTTKLIDFFNNALTHPEKFVIPDPSLRQECLEITKIVFDTANKGDGNTKNKQNRKKFGPISQLTISTDNKENGGEEKEEIGFTDNEQIWGIMQLRNKPVFQYAKNVISDLEALKMDQLYPEQSESEDQSDDDDDGGEGGEFGGFGTGSENENDKMDVDGDVNEQSEVDEGSDLDDLDFAQEDDQDDDDDEDEESDEEDQIKKSVVDDDFFSLAEMEKFADEAEEIEERDRDILAGKYPQPKDGKADESSDEEDDNDDEIDLFQDPDMLGDGEDDSEEDEKDASEIMYNDFFLPPKISKKGKAKESREKSVKRIYEDAQNAQRDAKKQKKGSKKSDSLEVDEDLEDDEMLAQQQTKNLFDQDDDDDDLEDKDENGVVKSEFEKQQERMRKRIEKMEDEIVAEKEWTMKGEVGSRARPLNSLLEEDLTFDYASKPVPLVTEEQTETLEALIKRRIIDNEFDDVVRKKEIEVRDFRPSERIELDDSKPKQSLAAEYEEDYLKQQSGSTWVDPRDDKVNKQHKELDDMFCSLCYKLDSLSNYHFTPKPAIPDVTIRADAPAIEMEEVLPVNQSTATQLAPEEVFDKAANTGFTGDMKGTSELDKTDRRRIKAKRKSNFKKKQQHQQQKTSDIKKKPTKDNPVLLA